MTILSNPKHEKFAQLVAAGQTATDAYTVVYGASSGARQSGGRLLTNVAIRQRISELQQQFSAGLQQIRLRERNSRLEMLQDRHNRLRQVMAERGLAYSKLNAAGRPAIEGEQPAPGAGTGVLGLDWRGKNAEQAVWKVDTGLLTEMRKIEEQIARELGEWNPDSTNAGRTTMTGPVQINVAFVSPRPESAPARRADEIALPIPRDCHDR